MTVDKDEKKATSNGLGAGALHFIRNRSSMRRQLTRDQNTICSKILEDHHNQSTSAVDSGGGGGVGGFGKWLREHLKVSKSNNENDNSSTSMKTTRGLDSSYNSTLTGSEKVLSRTTYTPQNVYCSLPREHRRHFHNSGKSSEGSGERTRSGSCHVRERSTFLSESTDIMRGSSIYGSEGKSSRRRNRDKRRHSMNDVKEHRVARRKR
ncbi:hypothetical protein PV328_001255 [Microctonus aethiopoides]|uniref:Uncharacterized protein n=1 Tax=Microctonus aethiopoides TaxID=144406 RepID=A0AA39KXD4_9HYME|nr:hypothetical protein PV328_001255 [Microctonus aethiopoides]